MAQIAGSRRRALSLGARALGLLLLGAAAAAPAVEREARGSAVVYVVDRSPSVGQAGLHKALRFVSEAVKQRGEARLGLVAFDGRPELRNAPGALDQPPLPEPEGRVDASVWGVPRGKGTDIEAAIDLAAGALPPGGSRRVVLLSDGFPTRGDAEAAARRAQARGVELDVIPVSSPAPDSPTISRVSVAESHVAEGEPITVVAELSGAAGAGTRIQWLRDGQPISASIVAPDEQGRLRAQLTDEQPGPGAHVYEARLLAADAPDPGTRIGRFSRHGRAAVQDEGPQPLAVGHAAAFVAGKPSVLVVSSDGECPAIVKDTLARSTLDLKTASLEKPLDAALLSSVDLVILADVPIALPGSDSGGLTPEVQQALLDYVKDRSGGLLVTGGTFGLAPEWADTPISRALPVEIENKGEVEDPQVAMAIMLDRSGSMGMMVGSHTKLDLAVEATLAAASTLRPDDFLAIGSVDEQTHWDLSLTKVAALAAHRQRIRSISVGGGGIYVFTAIRDAYETLAHVKTPLRHVLLFSDTADSEEQSQGSQTALALAERARRTSVSTSVVGIGNEDDKDTPFLRSLAAAGGGRFYLATKATDLRRIFVAETRAATRTNVREGTTPVLVRSPEHPALSGVDTSHIPALGGFVEARLRSTADTALITQDQRPILASWRYGLGRVVTLTTDVRADWQGTWASWAGAGQIMRQTVRFAMRRRADSGSDVRVSLRERSVDVAIETPEAREGEATSEPGSIEAFAVDEKGAATAIPLTPVRVGPRRWAARSPIAASPFVVARVRDAAGRLMGEAIGQLDSAAEHAGVGHDQRWLRSLAQAGGGLYDPEPSATLRPAQRLGKEPTPLWPALLIAAASLVALDLWLRRLGRAQGVVSLADLSAPGSPRS